MSFATANSTAAPTARVSTVVFNENPNKYEETFHENGSSIYVHWVPDEMTTEYAKWFFSPYGEVERVEFVPHKNGKGRMMFVHFQYWNNTSHSIDFRNKILEASPEAYPLRMDFHTGYMCRTYQIMCKVNKRPIPVVDYNTHQLSDMFERLNTRVTEEMDALRKENEELRNTLKSFTELAKQSLDVSIRNEQYIFQLRNNVNDLHESRYSKKDKKYGYCSESD